MVAGQCMAKPARIVCSGNALTQISQYQSFRLPAKLAQIAHGRAIKLDSPAWHVAILSRALSGLSLKALQRHAGAAPSQPAAGKIIVFDILDLP